MSLNPLKRRRIAPSQIVDNNTVTKICQIIMNLNLVQYKDILINIANCNYNKDMDDIQNILHKYSFNHMSFSDTLCGVDYMQINLNLFPQMNIDYNQEQDVLKLYHKQYNHR